MANTSATSNNKIATDIRKAIACLLVGVGFGLVVTNIGSSFKPLTLQGHQQQNNQFDEPNGNGITTHSSMTSTNVNNNINTIVYGHLHVAKTGGTNLNGRMAAKYDNVCGNKGYSFNSYRINAEKFKFNESSGAGRKKIELKGTQLAIMTEIGFENCDFISIEKPWQFWTQDIVKNLEFETRNMTLELHVPCRDAIDHLLSTCNHGKRTFNCPDGEEAIEQEIKNCLWSGGPSDKREIVDKRRNTKNRFNIDLQNTESKHSNNINLKCFKSFPLENYIDYMGNFLRPRKIESPYFTWDTNAARVASKECLLTKDQDYINTVRKLIFNVDYMGYYRFCHDCLGSNDELPL